MSKPLWEPKNPKKSTLWRFMQAVSKEQGLSFEGYQVFYEWSIQQPGLFWKSLCDFLDFKFDPLPQAILVINEFEDMMDARWFEGAQFNFAQKLLSRRDYHIAINSVNELGEKTSLTYKQLYAQVAHCAAGLSAIGLKANDRVAALMPNTAYTIIAMLAATSLGAIWAACSPDFGSEAAFDRLGQINPTVLFICDGHTYHGKKHSALEKIIRFHALDSLKQLVIIPNINEPIHLESLPKAIMWESFIKPADSCHFVSLPFNHPVYILFSSGTTGKPKCIVHGAGGTLLQHLKELALHCNLKAQDNLCFYTTCGWMMWNWMVSALALGSTLTLYEGSPTFPENSRLFQLIEQEKITVFGTSAKYLSTMEKSQVHPKSDCDLKFLRCILSTGSPLLPKGFKYVYEHIKTDVQLSSISGGSDIISCFALGNPLLPVYSGEIQCLGLGMAVAVFDEQGQAIENELGELVCTKPFPSMPLGFWNDPERVAYKNAYFKRFPHIWTHGDYAKITVHHGLIIDGRSDAILNPGGVRIGTAEIYRQLDKVDEIVDSVVIGQRWQDDIRLILFVVLNKGLLLNDELRTIIRQIIRQHASPRHVPAKILQVPDVPRTMNGKLVELAVRQVVHGESVNNLHSLVNPQCLDYFKNREELND
ncbi:MAG: acetoacetate--CoA ligase [Legionella sp.]|nr:acetoacetate--CoA ligase [Legionella sp.]